MIHPHMDMLLKILKTIITLFAEAFVFCGPCFRYQFMYKTVQEIAHPKIGLKHMPCTYVFYQVTMRTTYVTSLEGHNRVNDL